MNTKLEVVRYSAGDVVATSGEYYLAGMTKDSYNLVYGEYGFGEVCQWYLSGLTGTESYDSEFSYINEKGNTVDGLLADYGWLDISDSGFDVATGKWFHYKDGTFILCNDSKHHHKD